MRIAALVAELEAVRNSIPCMNRMAFITQKMSTPKEQMVEIYVQRLQHKIRKSKKKRDVNFKESFMGHIIKSYISEDLNECFKALIPNLHFNSEMLLLFNHNLFHNICVTSFCCFPGPGQLA